MRTISIIKPIILMIFFTILFILPIIPTSVYAQMPLLFPGRIEGTSKYFKITDSAYLNIALDSSESVKLRMTSIPEMITMIIEKSTSTIATQTQITINGFLPLTNYYKFEDNYHNLIQFTTDKNGSFTYIQDLSSPHFVFIQPRASTKFIKDNSTGGDCALIGIWNWSTKTCALTTDVNETIQIDDNNITLDGNSRTITGTNTGIGVYLYQKSGVTAKNTIIKNFSEGISFWSSTHNSVARNNITGNNDGIDLYYSDNNNDISTNVISGGKYDGVGFYNSSNNTFATNTVSSSHYDGIGLYTSNSNNITGNTILSSGSDGLAIYTSIYNNIIGNTISHSVGDGAPLYYSANNIFNNNTISDNSDGIPLYYSDSNTFIDNTISDNNGGMAFYHSNNNKIYNENFIDNSTQAGVYSGTGNIFNLNPPTGGNYWNNYDTPIEGCNDLNNDGFCDAPYIFYGGQDNLPWTKQDGWKLPPNRPPIFSNPNQYKSDGVISINESATTTESTAIFKAKLEDPDNDQIKLEVELRKYTEPFTGIYDGGILSSAFVLSGNTAAIIRGGLINGKYHWRLRAVDNQGNKSNWQEFGIPGNVDFEVKLVPLYTQVRSPYPSDDETKSWFNKRYGTGNYPDCLDIDPLTNKPIPGTSTIGRCGCVITSEVMLMRFYGITQDVDGNNVDPLVYNEWLTSNNGYSSAGNVNWEKIMDYTKDQFGVPRLFYSGPIDSKDTTYLDGQLAGISPTMLYTKVLNKKNNLIDHFILADGKLSNTYTIKDPAYYNTRYLDQAANSFAYDYNNNFLGLRIFSKVAVLPDSISATFASPAELLFTDPQGRRLGKDPINNIEYNEIPGGVYYQEGIGDPLGNATSPTEESKRIWIPEPIDGQYNVKVIGTGSGSYTFNILTYDNNTQSKYITQTGNILPNITQEFELNYSTTSAEQTKFQRIVQIDIKPGSDPNSINCKNSKEIIPVAILATDIFDATTVDPDTVRFGPNGAQETHRDKNGKARKHLEDVNKDGKLDLVLHFKFGDSGIQCDDTEAILTGQTYDGFDILGSDSIRTVQNGKQSIITKLLAAISGVLSAIVKNIL